MEMALDDGRASVVKEARAIHEWIRRGGDFPYARLKEFRQYEDLRSTFLGGVKVSKKRRMHFQPRSQ